VNRGVERRSIPAGGQDPNSFHKGLLAYYYDKVNE
jgi:hypothetical protein